VRYAQARLISESVRSQLLASKTSVVRRQCKSLHLLPTTIDYYTGSIYLRLPTDYDTSIYYPQARAELAQLAQENAQLQVDLGVIVARPRKCPPSCNSLYLSSTNPSPSPNLTPTPTPTLTLTLTPGGPQRDGRAQATAGRGEGRAAGGIIRVRVRVRARARVGVRVRVRVRVRVELMLQLGSH